MQREHKLILHCGGELISFEDLSCLPPPEPRTPTHFPIPHVRFIGSTRQAILNRGFTITKAEHAVSNKAQRYFGLFHVLHESVKDEADYSHVLGLRNSHDMTFPAGWSFGHFVTVCDNLLLNGDIIFKRKHTRFVLRDLPHVIGKAMDQFIPSIKVNARRIEHYKAECLSPRSADNLMLDLLRNDAITGTQLSKLVREYDVPTYNYGRNFWTFENCLTEVMKGTSPALMGKRGMCATVVIDRHAGFVQ